MNTPTLVAVFVAVWAGIGVVTGVWMIRRGHDPLWILIAVVLGPLFAPIALERVERGGSRLVAPGPTGAPPPRAETPGAPRVLVGMDGSPESQLALTTALRLFGDNCGMLVLAEVVSYDAIEDAANAEINAASARLTASANSLANQGIPVCFEVLSGPAGETLRRFAEQQETDLIVVGRRGRGLTSRLMGSVSAHLVHHSTVPVLVVEPSRVAPHRPAETAAAAVVLHDASSEAVNEK